MIDAKPDALALAVGGLRGAGDTIVNVAAAINAVSLFGRWNSLDGGDFADGEFGCGTFTRDEAQRQRAQDQGVD